MTTWITSDLHFGHTNIMKFCPETRGHFRDVQHMNEEMVRMWNEKVQPGDTVYILGDVAFCSASDAARILQRLNGDKILIEGNHDRKAIKDVSFQKCFKEIHKYLDINYNGHKIVMSHFPFLEWDQMHRGSLHFFGHLHGNKTGQEHFRCKDVGMDATGAVVITLDAAVNAIKDNQIKSHH
jgi:calcineurin-like phosphoesterase family protein